MIWRDRFEYPQAYRSLFPNFKLSTARISLHFPQRLLGQLEVPSNQRDVPLQTLLKAFFAERIAAERRTSA